MEPLLPMAPTDHYHILLDTWNKVQLHEWLKRNESDPALHVSTRDFSIFKWNDSVLVPGISSSAQEPSLISSAWVQVWWRWITFHQDWLLYCYHWKLPYILPQGPSHKLHTTYDLQQEQDSLNLHLPDCQCDGPFPRKWQKECPYWYAWILGIYHANICHVGPSSTSSKPQKMDFLSVHWFGQDTDPCPGWKTKHLLCLGFVPGNDGLAFGFLDPNQIIQAIHLLPAFKWGHITTKYLPRSPIACGNNNPDSDWQLYYVGKYIFYCQYLYHLLPNHTGFLTMTKWCTSEVVVLVTSQHYWLLQESSFPQPHLSLLWY